MNDVMRQDTNTEATASVNASGASETLPISTFEVVPYGNTIDEKELYSFREAVPAPQEPVAAKQTQPFSAVKMMVGIVLLALAAFIAYALYAAFWPKQPVAYYDLGSQRFDPAGLSGRLIALWDKSGSYELYLDPIGPDDAAAFAAAAGDPPRQLSVTIRLRDSAGLVTCQKQILFPPPAPRTGDDSSDSTPPQGPQQTATGDTVANMTGESGQVTEIDLRGPLPCSAKAFTTFKAWDFTADFPTPEEESRWQEQDKSTAGRRHHGYSWGQTERLSAPIEGNDVVVGENPSHGTVETSGGRVFYLGTASMRNRTSDWQVFPASIHFHCDPKGSCILTRSNSSISLQARLLK